MKFCLCLSLSLILHFAEPAFAQSDARYEASAGYSYLSTDRHGWVLSFTEKVGNRFGIETEVGGNYRKDWFFEDRPNFVHSILAGPQFKFRNEAKLVPWGHVLAGITLDNGPALSSADRLLFLRVQPKSVLDFSPAAAPIIG